MLSYDEVNNNVWKRLLATKIIGEDGRILKAEENYQTTIRNWRLESESETQQLNFILNSIQKRHREIQVPQFLLPYIELHLEDFINSAKTALFMQPGVDYEVDMDRTGTESNLHPKIVIIDRDTGTDLTSSQWHNGLHQFLQLKHGCKLTMMGLKAVFVSNVSYFRMYKNIYGLSGTLGKGFGRGREYSNLGFIKLLLARTRYLYVEYVAKMPSQSSETP